MHHAVPMTVRFNSSVVIDPVERYLHYESRYQSGAGTSFLRSFYTTVKPEIERLPRQARDKHVGKVEGKGAFLQAISTLRLRL